MEKHWRGIVKRTAVEPVLELLRKAGSANAVPPVISSNKNFLISIVRESIIFISVVQRDGTYNDEDDYRDGDGGGSDAVGWR